MNKVLRIAFLAVFLLAFLSIAEENATNKAVKQVRIVSSQEFQIYCDNSTWYVCKESIVGPLVFDKMFDLCMGAQLHNRRVTFEYDWGNASILTIRILDWY